MSKLFCDLSICEQKTHELNILCETLVELGYKLVAVNQSIGEPENNTKKRRKNEENANSLGPIPEPICLKELKKKFAGKLTLVNRLTFEFSDNLQAHNILQNPITRKYNLLAAIPKTQEALQLVCQNLAVDIISFDPANKYPGKLNRKMYNLAARRGVYFELMYVHAGSDGASRRSVISKGHQYFYFGKSKNILISSHASLPFQLKGPYDVINIGLLFGLSEEQSKSAITDAGIKVMNHGVCRKLGKGAPFLIEHDDTLEEMSGVSDLQISRKRPRLT